MGLEAPKIAPGSLVASLVPACLVVCSLCHTLPGHVVSLERCEQGSILQQQTKAIIPAGADMRRLGPACLGAGHWDQEAKPIDFGPGYFWVTRLRGGYGRGNGTIWKLGSLLVLWSLHGGSGGFFEPRDTGYSFELESS